MAEKEPLAIQPTHRPQMTLREALSWVKVQMKKDHEAVLVYLPEYASKTQWYVQASKDQRRAYLEGLALHYEIVPNPFDTSKKTAL